MIIFTIVTVLVVGFALFLAGLLIWGIVCFITMIVETIYLSYIDHKAAKAEKNKQQKQ